MQDLSVAPKTKKKWSKKKKFGITILVILAYLGLNFAATYFIPSPKLEISPDTVYLQNPPMNEYGTVDYIGWLNEQNSKGVTPDENVVTAFVEIFGTDALFASGTKAKALELLGMKDAPANGIFISPEEYQQQHNIMDTHKMDYLLGGGQYLWTSKESPETAAYLEANKAALDFTVRASHREYYYRPLISRNKLLLNALLPSLNKARTIAKVLVCRSNMLIAAGKLDEAWRDILAIRNIGLLMNSTEDRPISLIETLVGVAIRKLADKQARFLLQNPQLLSRQADKFLKQWQELAPSMLDVGAMLFTERLFLLDFLMAAHTGRLKDVSLLGKDFETVSVEKLNINLMLKSINQAHDEMLELFEQTRPCEMKKKSNEYSVEMIGEYSNLPAIIIKKYVLPFPFQRNFISRAIADLVASLLVPSLGHSVVLCNIEVSEYDLAEIGLALRCYEFKHGRYPEKLEQLSPEFLKKIPNDPLADNKPYKYKVTNKGFLLYGVGRNFEDDGGVKKAAKRRDRKKIDIVVEVPFVNPELPKKKERKQRRQRKNKKAS